MNKTENKLFLKLVVHLHFSEKESQKISNEILFETDSIVRRFLLLFCFRSALEHVGIAGKSKNERTDR